MTTLADVHDRLGGSVTSREGRSVVAHYGKPARAHQAVRNGVGVIDAPLDLVSITGEDRLDFLNNAITNSVPRTPDTGCYSLLLNHLGRIQTEMVVLNAGDRLLICLPAGQGQPLVDNWRENVFIEDVTIENQSTTLHAFGLHGPESTTKLAEVLVGDSPPEDSHAIGRGTMAGDGVTIVRTDAPTGEVGYLVVATSTDAVDVFDSLRNRGPNAVVFGTDTWDSLTLEAGTPTYPTELADRLPNVTGCEVAIDHDKGCYVGQEPVAKIRDRGQPPARLVGLELLAAPSGTPEITADGESVGEITRATTAPTQENAIAFGVVDPGCARPGTTVTIGEEEISGTVVDLPFAAGSEQSERVPRF